MNAPLKPGEMIDGTQIPVTNPFDLRPVYGNNFAISMTNVDITMHFTEMVTMSTPEGPQPRQEVKGIVTLPIEIAGHLAHYLLHEVARKQSENKALKIAQMGPLN